MRKFFHNVSKIFDFFTSTYFPQAHLKTSLKNVVKRFKRFINTILPLKQFAFQVANNNKCL